MSSNSSDDEDLERIREATDSQFMKDSMYKKPEDIEIDSTIQKSKLPPSLRRVQDKDDQFKLFNVTPQFQSYVSRALCKKLEESLKDSFREHSTSKKHKRHMHNCIKLLSSSKNFIEVLKEETLNVAVDINKSKVRQCLKHDEKSIINDSELEEVVVTGADILSLKGVEHWSNRSKTKNMFKYNKDSKGVLHFIEPEYKDQIS